MIAVNAITAEQGVTMRRITCSHRPQTAITTTENHHGDAMSNAAKLAIKGAALRYQ